MAIIGFVLGSTNSGKTTLINKLCERKLFFPVIIGQKLRELYPPEFFEGQAAPAKTDNIAFEIMCDGIKEAHNNRMIPIVDGQPRNHVQYELCKKYFDDRQYNCKFINLWASKDIRVSRARNRDIDENKLKLSMERMDNDSIMLYDIVSRLHIDDYDIRHFNSETLYYNIEIEKFLEDITSFACP